VWQACAAGVPGGRSRPRSCMNRRVPWIYVTLHRCSDSLHCLSHSVPTPYSKAPRSRQTCGQLRLDEYDA
jgi:hypothetical protein